MARTGFFRQRGFSFVGLLFVACVVAVVGVVIAQITPTVVEFYTVKRLAQRASEGTTVVEVHDIFTKGLSLNNIQSLTADALDVTKVSDRMVVAFAYQREIHLVGPAYLTLKYEGRTN